MAPSAGALAEVDESTLLPALRAGDEGAFQRLTAALSEAGSNRPLNHAGAVTE